MKFTALTLLLATLAVAGPAPKPDAEPVEVTAATRHQFPRTPTLDSWAASIRLQARDPKKKSGGSSGGKNNNGTNAASGMLSPSRVLEFGALSLGVLEIVNLWV